MTDEFDWGGTPGWREITSPRCSACSRDWLPGDFVVGAKGGAFEHLACSLRDSAGDTVTGVGVARPEGLKDRADRTRHFEAVRSIQRNSDAQVKGEVPEALSRETLVLLREQLSRCKEALGEDGAGVPG